MMPARRRPALSALALALVVLLAGCVPGFARHPRDPAASSSATVAALPTGDSPLSLQVDGAERTYGVYVPQGLSGPAPLVLMLHGGYGTGAQAERAYGWDGLADAEHVVVAYPDGAGRAWNSGGGCCGLSAREGIDDVAFLTAVVADLEARVAIDPDRVYAAGMSNGAMMAYRLACETTVFAAVGAVSGTISPDTACDDPAPVSVMAVHGTADTRVLYDGGTSTVGSAHIDARAAPEVSAFWRGVDDCPDPVVTTAPPLSTASSDCPDGRGVTLVTIDGYGHEWPSTGGSQTPYGEPVYDGWDATTALWRFFAAHPKP